jgi:hypothetical protein
MMEHAQLSPHAEKRLLVGWSHEQRQLADEATRATMVNGSIVNRRSAVLAFLHRVVMRLLWMIPGIPARMTSYAFGDHTRLAQCENGFFLAASGGGRNLSQIWIQNQDGSPQLSDSVIFREESRLALLVLIETVAEVRPADVEQILKEAHIGDAVLSMSSVTFLCRHPRSETNAVAEMPSSVYYPCTRAELVTAGITPIKGYDETTLRTRLGRSAKYIIARPDFLVHSIAASAEDFHRNVEELRKTIYTDTDL